MRSHNTQLTFPFEFALWKYLLSGRNFRVTVSVYFKSHNVCLTTNSKMSVPPIFFTVYVELVEAHTTICLTLYSTLWHNFWPTICPTIPVAQCVLNIVCPTVVVPYYFSDSFFHSTYTSLNVFCKICLTKGFILSRAIFLFHLHCHLPGFPWFSRELHFMFKLEGKWFNQTLPKNR